MVWENISSKTGKSISLHGIEIKVSKYDLVNDHKMLEYDEYVDYSWLAIPAENKEMLDEAQKILLPHWGIMLISGADDNKDNPIKIHRAAQEKIGAMREISMERIILK